MEENKEWNGRGRRSDWRSRRDGGKMSNSSRRKGERKNKE